MTVRVMTWVLTVVSSQEASTTALLSVGSVSSENIAASKLRKRKNNKHN